MQASENVDASFTEKVPSNSRSLNPLGIQYHLDLQEDLVPGITSVTERIRYYTLQAWYYQYLFEDKVMEPKEFERTFILACLAHHNGNSSHPDLLHVHNRTRFDGEWDDKNKFKLDFDIAGFGRTYYVAQLEVLRCAWTDKLNRTHYTSLNKRLADTLKLPAEAFEKEEYTKEYLKENLSNLCVCNQNPKEIEILSKIFFGFFSKTKGDWDIDKDEFERFKNGKIELNFDEELKSSYPSQEKETREKNLRRRNTLFMFLKIISETNPTKLRKSIWDAIYFSQIRGEGDTIDFGDIEKVRKYWEFFQLNLYYVYSVEMILDVLQHLIRKNNGIKQEELLAKLEDPKIKQNLKELLDQDCQTINEILTAIQNKNKSKKTNLDSPINESLLYTKISDSDDWKEKAATSLLLLLALKFRYEQFSSEIKEYVGPDSRERIIRGRLNIDDIYDEIDKRKDDTVVSFLKDLIRWVKRKHVFEASSRLRDSNTRAWIFTEEERRLFFARQSPTKIHPRDNRWKSINSLLTDLKFIKERDNKTVLTEKGKKWLQMIE